MTTIPASMLAAAPRVWIDQGRGLKSRVIDPAWRRSTIAKLEAEAVLEAERAARRLADEEAEHEVVLAQAELAVLGTCVLRERLHRMRPMTRLIELIAARHGVHGAEVCGDARRGAVGDARHHAAYELRRVGHSLMTIARALHRDHSTIRHSIIVWPARAASLGIECEPLSAGLQPRESA